MDAVAGFDEKPDNFGRHGIRRGAVSTGTRKQVRSWLATKKRRIDFWSEQMDVVYAYSDNKISNLTDCMTLVSCT